MPLYDYICLNKHEFARVAEFNEARPCPRCGADVKRQFPKRNHVVWGQGASLVDIYDRDHAEMTANGELNGN